MNIQLVIYGILEEAAGGCSERDDGDNINAIL